MSFTHKTIWVQLLTVLAWYSIYLFVVLGRAGEVPLVEVAYVTPALITIGGSIVVSIVASIGLGIAQGCAEPLEVRPDERDRTIERFGDRIGNHVFAVLGLGPLGLAMADVDSFWIANAMLLAYVIGSLTSLSMKLVGYHRGI